jgi:hypothetical protein
VARHGSLRPFQRMASRLGRVLVDIGCLHAIDHGDVAPPCMKGCAGSMLSASFLQACASEELAMQHAHLWQCLH